MTIGFTCSGCQKNISVPSRYAGRQVRCPACDHVQFAPAAAEPTPVAASVPREPQTPDHPAAADPERPDPQEDGWVHIDPTELPPTGSLPPLSERIEQDRADTTCLGMLAYPFTGSGKFNMLMIVIPVVLFAVMQFVMLALMRASFVPLAGKFIVLAADLAFVIYVGAYMLSIISSSANGEVEPPDWPAFSAWWSDVIRPVLSCWIVSIVPFIPAIVYFVWAIVRDVYGTRGSFISEDTFRGLIIMFWVSVVAGWALSPMMLLAAVLYEPLQALSPSLIFGSILKTFPAYLGTVLFMFFVNALQVGVSYLGLRFLLPRDTAVAIIVFYTIIGFVFIYCSIVMMRLLGMFYFKQQQELDWF